jgi:hypothetical protein
MMAALGELASSAPDLYDEAVATKRGLRALKDSGKYTPAEIKKARNTLIWGGGTYGAHALADAAISAGTSSFNQLAKQTDSPEVAVGATLAPMLAKRLVKPMITGAVSAAFTRSAKKSPVITPAEAEGLRRQMGVRAQIYEADPEILEDNAAYVRGGGHRGPLRGFRQASVETLLAEKDRKKRTGQASEVLRRGGVLLPKTASVAADEWEKDPPSLGKRIAKGVGLGALTVGTAGGLIAASDPKTTKRLIQHVRQHGIKGLKKFKLASIGPPARETLSRTHWPALAKALAK